MGEAGVFVPDNRIGEMLVSSRSLAEYRAMFALTDSELTKTILDCPGGASSFTAEVSAGGGRALACDPCYARPLADVEALTRADLLRGYHYHQRNPDEYVWTFFAGPDHYLASRSRSIDLFAGHAAANPGRYVAASLPALPFPDRSFDLALSSHLLFSYSDRLNRHFHLDSILELTRVAAEVRVFPLVPMGFTSNPELPSVLSELAGAGVLAEVQPVDYEFQRGGHSMLSCRLTG
jgi:SAM-dependent methyltransferase